MQHVYRGYRRPPARLMSAVATVALMTASAAYAQAPAPSTAEVPPEQLETVQVTGSRILNSDAASANPITVVGQEQMQQEQSTTVEQILRKVPAVDFSGGATAGTSN